jgi:hypothetical protein
MKYNTIELFGRKFEVFEDGRVYRSPFIDPIGRQWKRNKLKFRNNGNGYMMVDFHANGKYRNVTLHRMVATAFVENLHNFPQVDHINGDKNNNHPSNLRWVNGKQNNRGYKQKTANKTSRFRGVHWEKRRKKWVAQISARGLQKFGGYFDSEIEAAIAYNKLAISADYSSSALNKIDDYE